MSKIGKKTIELPERVEVAAVERRITVRGPLGEVSVPELEGVRMEQKDRTLSFTIPVNRKQTRSNWGTARALIANAVEGVTKGYAKTLLLEGVGYRITKEGDALTMALGFSHPVRVETPPDITFEVEKNTILRIKGIDKQRVGQTAAEIRSLRKPEPYKGKGFRYENEIIRRKAGKKAAA